MVWVVERQHHVLHSFDGWSHYRIPYAYRVVVRPHLLVVSQRRVTLRVFGEAEPDHVVADVRYDTAPPLFLVVVIRVVRAVDNTLHGIADTDHIVDDLADMLCKDAVPEFLALLLAVEDISVDSEHRERVALQEV